MDQQESRELNSTLTQILTEFRQSNINITRVIDILLNGDFEDKK